MVATALACGARTSDGPDSGAVRPLVECDGGAVPKPLDAGSCYGTCCSPKVGNDTSLTSPAAAVNALVGKWQLCSTFPGAPADTIGIELATPTSCTDASIGETGSLEASGNLNFLVRGADGPEPGQGFAYISQWQIYGQGSSYSLSLGNNGSALFLYSACPPQLEVQVYYDAGGALGGQNADILLVPF